MPTTTPTQFDPGQLKASIIRLMQFRPRKLYLTHYSEVGDCARLANDMVDAVDEFVTIARAAGPRRHGDACDSICAGSRTNRLREHGCTLSRRRRSTRSSARTSSSTPRASSPGSKREAD